MPGAWSEYKDWEKISHSTQKKIDDLIEDILRLGPLKGRGKPEALRHRKEISRRIDHENRLVYFVNDRHDLVITSCKGHYKD
jgi:toxin YoeB